MFHKLKHRRNLKNDIWNYTKVLITQVMYTQEYVIIE